MTKIVMPAPDEQPSDRATLQLAAGPVNVTASIPGAQAILSLVLGAFGPGLTIATAQVRHLQQWATVLICIAQVVVALLAVAWMHRR